MCVVSRAAGAISDAKVRSKMTIAVLPRRPASLFLAARAEAARELTRAMLRATPTGAARSGPQSAAVRRAPPADNSAWISGRGVGVGAVEEVALCGREGFGDGANRRL